MFIRGTSLAIQWLKLLTTISGGTGSIPGWGTKILHAAQHGQKEKKYVLWSGKSRIGSTGSWFIVAEGVFEEVSDNSEKKNRAVEKDGSED